MSGRVGEAVDRFGGSVIDPTKNVLDLTHAESRRQDGLREAEARLQVALLAAEHKLQNAMREAETRRINELAALRAQYDIIIEGIRSKAMDSTSTLLAQQLREVKAELADRMAKMEQFRWESGGSKTGAAGLWTNALAAGGFVVAVIVMALMFLRAPGI